MKRVLTTLLALCLVLTMTTAASAQSVEVRNDDGSRWRGEIGDQVELTYVAQNITVSFAGTLVKAADLYLVIEGDEAGTMRQKTIFRDDIISMKTAGADEATTERTVRPKRTARTDDDADVPRDANGNPMGVIVLPMEGFVGGPFRREEIIEVGKKADEFGPGQIIVLVINSNGGSALESQFIADEIFKLRERHRVVAWIKKAISAGCQTAMCCQEIYFMTEGTAGAVTTWNPGSGTSIKGEELRKSMEHLARIAERSGYSEYIAKSMKTNSALCSYDKDPETGEVTFYGDLSGEFILSDGNSNLSFTSSVAEHCGFSKGTADTPEQLAKLLDLPEWHELTDYGREIAAKWQKTYETAEKEVPRILARFEYYKTGGTDAQAQLGARISLLRELIRWWDRCPNYCMYNLPAKEVLERQLKELRKAMADLRRRGG